ncbi:sigma-70 family RNA polymerase sigma factor [Psychrobacillus glaciei]|uniref:Sigma-70 family RNA polymerase sigma factor n=1 Tax=Psychrobacillus glaciei TaxID=2283160 RepID=A0A5J6SUD2_9BACI|nr:sigma-70 family RNA polymerase sigma factor [Psychrobacillus glaciei]QFF99877.1 sigma-70 family RNA polymerase sigma factor [Psychrobacillus glaciei]
MYTNVTEYVIEESHETKVEELLKEYHQKIYVYCYNILRNAHDAEDAAQEVFIKAFQSKKLMEISNSSAWLYRIAYNYCLNKIKRKKMIEFIPFAEKGRLQKETDSSGDYSDFELSYILAQLKPKERALIVLRIIEDKDFTEIASILEISIPNARKRFERIKAKIQKIIERRSDNGQ